ncbi:hypothetical protein ES705_25047 [subsurface metagenome]
MTDLVITKIEEDIKDDRGFKELLDKCDSNLEKGVLIKIKELELRIPDEAQKIIYDEDKPIAKADFFFKPNIVLFVDGPAHEKDYVKEDDERKRDELRGLGFRVFAVNSAKDIEDITNVLK